QFQIIKMIVRLAKFMSGYSLTTVVLLIAPSTFLTGNSATAYTEGFFYMVQAIFSIGLPVTILNDRAVRSSLRTFSIFRSTLQVLTVRVTDNSSTTSTADPPNHENIRSANRSQEPNRYVLT
ncbi:hypothetical protein PFISCL1PPCAC_11137, partial [Pristionchus fissidentatus]